MDQVLSAKVLGFHGLAVLLPQVLEGVAAVWLLFHLVQRRFGSAAGLLAGFLLAITPISVASDRSSNTDSCLVLVLLLAAWALIKAIETGRRAPLVLSMALVGLGFNVKMLAAFVVLPAFALAHWLGARLLWRRLIADWGVASLVLAGVSLSWVVAFDLTPADRRPFAGSTTGNSMIELVVGHNGVGRFVRRARPAPPSTGDPLAATARSAPWTAGATIGPGPGGSRPSYLVRAPIGPLRLADRRLAAQVAWFFPLAVVGLVAGASWARRRWPLDAAARICSCGPAGSSPTASSAATREASFTTTISPRSGRPWPRWPASVWLHRGSGTDAAAATPPFFPRVARHGGLAGLCRVRSARLAPRRIARPDFRHRDGRAGAGT